MSSGVTTRAQKRRIGQRDLWDVIVNNDDICFKHILPKLNQTDIKFLYGVNSETRALIKRSPYVDELKKKFRVRQMSSISTLEFAWDNIQWGAKDGYWCVIHQPRFCQEVAYTNKLELLKWAREEKKCKWCSLTINAAALQGNLEMVKYCVANRCAPWDSSIAAWAAHSGHLHILEHLVECKYDEYDELACHLAASDGHLDCLKYLHETAKAPWDSQAVQKAHMNNHPECLQYLLDNDCPLPRGWRYEHGELHLPESSSS